jgi:hypothetical protein
VGRLPSLEHGEPLGEAGLEAVLIEADARTPRQLAREHERPTTAIASARASRPSAPTRSRHLLAREAPGLEIDLLSIDVDGDDYFVLASLDAIAPRVIVCEYNPTIPPHLDLVPEAGNYFGCSALALVRVAARKGYRLVAVTDTNCFFVRAADFAKFAAYETSLSEIAVTRHLTYLMTGYRGDYVLSREPTYGSASRPRRSFDQRGSVATAPQRRERGSARRRLARWSETRSAVARFGARRGGRSRDLRRMGQAFAPAADAYLHPLWREAQPAFAALLRSGLPRDLPAPPRRARSSSAAGIRSAAAARARLSLAPRAGPARAHSTARRVAIGCPRSTVASVALREHARHALLLRAHRRARSRPPISARSWSSAAATAACAVCSSICCRARRRT